MSDDDKPKLRGLRPARVRRPGDPIPEPPPTDLVPELRGPTSKLKFVADTAIVDAINDHADRLYKLPGFYATSPSDSIRSLIMEGARSFAAKFSESETNEDTDE